MDKKLWLWKNGDHFWAFEHLYPKVSPHGDPCTLGEPVGYALLKSGPYRLRLCTDTNPSFRRSKSVIW